LQALGRKRAEVVEKRRDRGIVAHLAQPHEVGLQLVGDEAPRFAEQQDRLWLHENVAVLADRIAHPRELRKSRDTLGRERPHHDEAPVAAPGNDRERRGRFIGR
jgi:hypothetical protein